jgi:hypothetical protein
MFIRGLFYGENLQRYKQDVNIDNDNQALYNYLLETMKSGQPTKDIVNLPLDMFIMLYHEIYTKNNISFENVKENS